MFALVSLKATSAYLGERYIGGIVLDAVPGVSVALAVSALGTLLW